MTTGPCLLKYFALFSTVWALATELPAQPSGPDDDGKSAHGDSTPAIFEDGHFIAGADISALKKIEDQGGVFRKNGVAGDAIKILADEGINMFRIRLFLDPDGRDVVVNDLPYTLALAERIKAANCGLLLDFHYSDTWADPGKQYKPAAWEDLNFTQLKEEVEMYTASVISNFVARGITPDIVQIGNEVTSGMCWSDGKLYTGDHDMQWKKFTDLLKAGIAGARSTVPDDHSMKIMIHIDRGGDWEATKGFYNHLASYNVEYDIVGLSYYPWWHGPLSGVEQTCRNTAQQFKKPIIIVEAAYPFKSENYWNRKSNMDWPISEAGQAKFLKDVANTVRNEAGAYGMGVVYWYPEAIAVPGLSVWNGGATALFGTDGEVHSGASSMKPNP